MFYVTVDHLGKEGYLTKTELRELSDLGFEIGSHSLTHRHLNDLDAKEIRSELVDSKNVLEEITGKRVDHFSCPGGRVNALVTDVAVAAGYKSVATSQLGSKFSAVECLCTQARGDKARDEFEDIRACVQW